MRMNANVGSADRIARLILGVVLILAPFLTKLALWQNATVHWGVVVIGVVFIATALFRFCPLYRLIGASTCKST